MAAFTNSPMGTPPLGRRPRRAGSLGRLLNRVLPR
jgi:hypothetical protein